MAHLKQNNMQLLAKLNAATLFLQEWLNCPRQIGAIAPAPGISRPPWHAGCLVVPTPMCSNSAPAPAPSPKPSSSAACARTASSPSKNPQAGRPPPRRFPRAKIITGDAFQLDELIRGYADRIGAVFSSLPLLNFEPHTADTLAKKIRALLPAGGKLVQYSYHLGNRQPKAAAHFRYVASNCVWMNLPPARVSVYQK